MKYPDLHTYFYSQAGMKYPDLHTYFDSQAGMKYPDLHTYFDSQAGMKYPFVGRSNRIGGRSILCTVELITPKWAMTAGHCILNSYNTGENVAKMTSTGENASESSVNMNLTGENVSKIINTRIHVWSSCAHKV
jgi:hypothetical protein